MCRSIVIQSFSKPLNIFNVLEVCEVIIPCIKINENRFQKINFLLIFHKYGFMLSFYGIII